MIKRFSDFLREIEKLELLETYNVIEYYRSVDDIIIDVRDAIAEIMEIDSLKSMIEQLNYRVKEYNIELSYKQGGIDLLHGTDQDYTDLSNNTYDNPDIKGKQYLYNFRALYIKIIQCKNIINDRIDTLIQIKNELPDYNLLENMNKNKTTEITFNHNLLGWIHSKLETKLKKGIIINVMDFYPDRPVFNFNIFRDEVGNCPTIHNRIGELQRIISVSNKIIDFSKNLPNDRSDFVVTREFVHIYNDEFLCQNPGDKYFELNYRNKYHDGLEIKNIAFYCSQITEYLTEVLTNLGHKTTKVSTHKTGFKTKLNQTQIENLYNKLKAAEPPYINTDKENFAAIFAGDGYFEPVKWLYNTSKGKTHQSALRALLSVIIKGPVRIKIVENCFIDFNDQPIKLGKLKKDYNYLGLVDLFKKML